MSKNTLTAVMMATGFILPVSLPGAEEPVPLPIEAYTVTVTREDAAGKVLNSVTAPAIGIGGILQDVTEIPIRLRESELPRYWIVKVYDYRGNKGGGGVHIEIGDTGYPRDNGQAMYIFNARGMPDEMGKMIVYESLEEKFYVTITPDKIPNKTQ